MFATAVRVSLYPEMTAVIPQENSNHPIGKKIRQYYEERDVKIWKDMVVFSAHESIPRRLRKYRSEGCELGDELAEGQIEGNFDPHAICLAMKEEGWGMIAMVQVTEAWIEMYFRR